MRKTVTLFLSILAFTTLHAQQVQKCCGSTNSSFLLGSENYARHNQSLYLPSDFNDAIDGNITHIYYRYGTVNEDVGNTLTDLVISMVQNQQTSFVNDMFVTEGLVPVLSSAIYTIPPGVQDTWFMIELDTPFPYDPTLSLIVDIRFDLSETLLTCRSVATPGRKISTGDPLSPVGTASSTNLHDIGFDLDATTGIPTEDPMVTMLYPNPATDALRIAFGVPLKQTHQTEVIDASGRILFRTTIASGSETLDLNVAGMASGMYMVRLLGEDGSSLSRSFIRE